VAPLEPAAHTHVHQQSLNSPPRSPSQLPASDQGNLGPTFGPVMAPRAPIGSVHPSTSNPILPDLNWADPMHPLMYQPNFGTPGLGSTDPFIHVHFPIQPTQPPTRIQQTFILQTPRRLNIMTTPLHGHRNIQPAANSPSTAATIRRGLAAISESESSDDSDGNSEDLPSRQRAVPKKDKAHDVWEFFRSLEPSRAKPPKRGKGRQSCTFCEYVHFHYYLL
jgi:hypothetical protein